MADLLPNDRSLTVTYAGHNVISASTLIGTTVLHRMIFELTSRKTKSMLNKRRIRSNKTKSVKVTFANSRRGCRPAL